METKEFDVNLTKERDGELSGEIDFFGSDLFYAFSVNALALLRAAEAIIDVARKKDRANYCEYCECDEKTCTNWGDKERCANMIYSYFTHKAAEEIDKETEDYGCEDDE